MSVAGDAASGQAAIVEWLARHVARTAGIERDEVDVTASFAAHGIGSVDAVSLAGELGDRLGLTLPETLAWDFPTIETLARHLASRLEAA